jgi:hypothetical protein
MERSSGRPALEVMFGRARLPDRVATGIAVRLEGERGLRFLELPRRAPAEEESEPVWLTLADADFTPLANPLDERVIARDAMRAHVYLMEVPEEVDQEDL